MIETGEAMKRASILAPLVVQVACTNAQVPDARRAAIEAIRKTEAAQAAALGRNDLDAATAVFAENARLYMPGAPPAIGRRAIRAANERALADPALRVIIDEASRRWWVSGAGDLATTTYSYAWTHSGPRGQPVTEQVLSQTTWVRDDSGTWRNVSDINAVYPSDARPAGARR